MPKPPFSEDCATKPTRKRNGDEGYREQIRHSLRRKSRKNALFRSQICTFASDNSERSLAIQNNVPQSTSLISKSLPIYSPLNGNTLLLSKIVRKQKIARDLLKGKRNFTEGKRTVHRREANGSPKGSERANEEKQRIRCKEADDSPKRKQTFHRTKTQRKHRERVSAREPMLPDNDFRSGKPYASSPLNS